MNVTAPWPTIRPERWAAWPADRRAALLTRSAPDLGRTVEETRLILERLRADPEKELLREYGPLKPGLRLADLRAGVGELDDAVARLPLDVAEALRLAKDNIEKFHALQLERPMWAAEIVPGLLAGRITRPLERVGVYVPGGRAAYPSSALMNIVPAKTAGVPRVAAATPPGPGLQARPEILAACRLAGADEVWKLGGAWAVGCLAYGLGGPARVDKIVGPGSSWVTAAKLAVFGQVDVDQPAGPSEGFIIADRSADPTHLAWDFLSQLEHDPQAAAVLATTEPALAEAVAAGVNRELPGLERAGIVAVSLANAAVLIVDSLEEAFELADEYAPEHLELVVENPLSLLGRIRNAGSIFLGPWSPIPAGDYASGPNHVLPTGGSARAFSGLSVDSFLKKMTFQQLTREALTALAPTVETLARAEGLPAHAKCLAVRRA